MLNQYGGFVAYDIMYDTGGHLVNPPDEDEMIAAIASGGANATASNIFIISHGWNNNIDEARALYAGYFGNVRAVLNANQSTLAGEAIVVALFWPSKRFTDPTEIPGGAAGLGDPLDAQLNAQLDDMKILFPDATSVAAIEHARNQIPTLAVSQSAQDDFVASLVSVTPQPRGPADEGLDNARRELSNPDTPGHVVLQRLSMPLSPVVPPPLQGGAADLSLGGAAAGVGSLFSSITGGIKSGAVNLANALTYYTMKDRSGLVGSTGAVQTIRRIRQANAGLKVHLIGHSFGGRLVTAAANALTSGECVATMTLLEAAYSHDGLAQDWDGAGDDGAFRSVISQNKVSGTILITHSCHDWPVGTAYPIASRIMNQVAAGLIGGADDKYGGMGRNGAQHTPESIDDTLHEVSSAYAPYPPGKRVRNLNGDGPPPAPTINSHGDVTKPEIAYAFLEMLK